MTVEQFDALPERQDVFEELHCGLLIHSPRPKAWHVKLQMRLSQLLQPAAADQGYVVMELPFRAVAQYDLRAADVAFISKSRWDEVNDGYLFGPPELVVEIVSPSNTKTQLREYAALCLANGCEEFWVVDHKAETVTVTDKNGQSVQYLAGMNVPIKLLNSVSLPVNQIFS